MVTLGFLLGNDCLVCVGWAQALTARLMVAMAAAATAKTRNVPLNDCVIFVPRFMITKGALRESGASDGGEISRCAGGPLVANLEKESGCNLDGAAGDKVSEVRAMGMPIASTDELGASNPPRSTSPATSHLPAGLFACSAKACAIFTARAYVSA